MSESLINRVGRLLAGTFTSMVNAAENAAPDVVAAQAIEQIDKAIDDVRAEIGIKQATRHNANRELEALNNRHAEVESRIQTAIKSEREDLAEAATAELIGIEDRIPLIEKHVAEAAAEEEELQKYLSGLRAKREEMKDDLKLIREQTARKAGEGVISSGENNRGTHVERRVENATNAVERVKSSISGLPEDKDKGDLRKRAELEELHQKNRIQERLAALKKAD